MDQLISGTGRPLQRLLLLCLLTLALLTATKAARQNPLKDPKICGRPQCEPNTSKFHYGHAIYKYDYSFDLRTEFSGTGENISDLYLKASIDLLFPKPCEGFLRINDVKLWERLQVAKEENGTDGTTSSSEEDYYGEFIESSNSADLEMTYLHGKSAQLAVDLQKHFLRFAFHDGLISEVCPHASEPVWVLNMKKGMLSAFQNTMLRFDVDYNTTETDVSGQCNVQYSLESTDDVYVTIRKVKDIGSCKQRYSTHSVLQTTPYTFREDKTIWPILNSESYCNLTIDNNIYREVSCYERHQLIPFSNSSTGAVTTTKTTFQFKEEESYNTGEFLADNNELIEKRSPLLFDHTPAVKPTHGEIKASRELLKQMCKNGFPNIQREFIDAFTSFLQTTKSLDYKALTQLLAHAASICENGKNHVLESLPYMGSTASYQLMRDQIVANAISKSVAQNWMTSLSFIQRPDEETLETFCTILEFSHKKVDPEYTLGASAVIHNFCKHNPDCALNLKVGRIVNHLETEFLNLFNMFREDRRTRERMIVILKGLSNIGVISDGFADELQEIIVEDVVPVDIRLQSVLAFRRVDCLKHRKFFLNTYANFSINSEIRIHSYLQSMRCPDYKIINIIKKVLEEEEVNQVGSFVWSHLKNLAKSSSPIRIEAQGLLLNDDLSDKFKMDIRKFSRNYEHSLFFDEYNFGTTTDMNLIFGTDSYLPRMATLNFTADLFGQSVNFFEFSARAEGFEELVSSIFGPKGPLNREVFRKKLSFLNRWLGNESSEDDDTLENLLSFDNLRFKRNANNEFSEDGVEVGDYDFGFDDDLVRLRRSNTPTTSAEARKSSLQQQVNNFGYKLKYNYNNPRAQIGVRVFGNDLRYYTLEGMLEVMALAKEFDPLYQTSKILSGKEFIYTKSRVLLDASYNVPLGIGVPLSIHAFGASSVDLRISGNLETKEPLSDWHLDVEGKFKPSVSVDVITSMQSDMYYAISGIKVKSNMYSNSEVEAKLKVRGNKLVSFSFNLPQDVNEIFSARSELLVMMDNKDVPQKGIERRRANNTCTWPVLDEAIGLKMCSQFSVPDLSNSVDSIYPGLLLSGPLNFSVILMKSDLTAKKYIFEYKSEQVANVSNWSFVFFTPGSAVKRLLVTNVTTVPDAFNASVSFENGRRTAAAGCKYNGDPDNRRLNVFLDTNGNKSLDLSMELIRTQDRSAWVYAPKMLLAVNGVNITGLIGKIRILEKKGIMQNDIELSFETKKLQAMVRGIIVKTEINTSTNMTVNYRFLDNKVETIHFQGKLTNTGDKSKTEYRSNIRLRASAHPKLNFASNGTWLSLQGHTEGVLTHNNAPNEDPTQTSLMRVVFARTQESEDQVWEGSRTKASLEVKVPKSKVDVRILVKHEERSKNGTEHNVILALRYAPEREATALFSVHLPRRNLFAVDAYMNVTIPDFNSCTARIKIIEKATKDYMINLNGSWFTGHSIALRGNYKDRSSRVQALHHCKLIVESPSFEMTSLNIVYRRNQLVLFADMQAKYGKDPYALTLQMTSNADYKNSNADLRFIAREKEYWVNLKMLSEQPKLLQIEIHLDKLRDIHMNIKMVTLDRHKELQTELKWDANRDPTQRLALLAEYNNRGGDLYDGNVMVTYPDRTLSCSFEANTSGPKYYGNVLASWSINEVIAFTYNAGFMPGKDIHNWVQAEITTPFDGWRRNSLQAGVYNMGNLILANTSLLWADSQALELGYKSDYNVQEPILSFDVRMHINSTIKDIPTISVKLVHWQNLKKFDSNFHLRYSGLNDTLNVYSIKSNWELFQNQRFQNISGIVMVLSPFEEYRKGGLAARFSLSDQREITGAASLNFDVREFTFAMDGYVKKFTDNMLIVNITTPLEKFRHITGRFGLNEPKRHAVAEVRAPTAALGAEALCDIKNLMNFDIKLSVATPIETFQQAAIFAKVNIDTVDLRGMWNNATLGFTGVWRMENLTNFEYSYMVYTPLVGFEENGFIAKLIKRDVFILTLYGKLSHYKLGLMINGQPKSKQLKQLAGNKMELEILYDDDFQPPKLEEDYELDDSDYEDFLSYFVDFKLDTLVWPTIDGAVDIQEIMDFYLVVGHMHLPQGRVEIKDRLYYPDYINVLNVLHVKTPFHAAKELKSIVEYHVDLDFKSFYEKAILVLNSTYEKPKEIGFEFNYTKVIDTLKPRQHNVKLNVKIPFVMLDNIDIEALVELDENLYKGNISSTTVNTQLALAAALEIEDNFLETSVGLTLNTKVVPDYTLRGYFKRDYSEVDNMIDVYFEVVDNGTSNKLQVETSWRREQTSVINANVRVHSTMLPLKLAETHIMMTKDANPQLNFDLAFVSRTNQRIEYGTRASKKKDIYNVEIWTPLKNFKNISMHGSLIQSVSRPYEYRVTGHLYRNMATYTLNGIIKMDDGYPADVRIRVQPKTGGRDGVIEFSISDPPRGSKGMNFQFSAAEDGKMCQISGGYTISDDGVDCSVIVQSTESEIARINFNGKLAVEERGHWIVDATLETPWRQLGLDKVNVHTELNSQKANGNLAAEYNIAGYVGRGNCLWSLQLEQDMRLQIDSYYARPNNKGRIAHASIKYVNPNKDFQRVVAGAKLSLDELWNLELNGTGNYRSTDDVQFLLITQLPPPVGDVHQLSARYQGNLLSKQGSEPNVFFEGKYQSQDEKRRALSRISYRNLTDLQGMAHMEWGVAELISVMECDFQMLRKHEARREFYAKLITPLYRNEGTFFLTGNYDLLNDDYHNLVCSVDYPATRRIADMDVSFKTLSNMFGYINSTTPFHNITWLKTDFNFSTNGGETYRYCRGDWSNDFAYFKLHSIYSSQDSNYDLNGNIELNVPLATRHRADIEYSLKENDMVDNGHVKVAYNDKQILNGLYKRSVQHNDPIYKDITQITLENDMKPLGVRYENMRNHSNPHAGVLDVKHVEVYELRNSKNFNLTGELHTRSTLNGQEIKIVAIHPNRTMVLTANYEDVNKHIMRQRTKLELSQTAWIGYNIEISNFTKLDDESQGFLLELSYPKRTLGAVGSYYMTENIFDANVTFKWTTDYNPNEQKDVRTRLRWKTEPLTKVDRDNQTVVFTLGHPYLEKDVTFKGNYYRGIYELLKTDLVIDYSEDPQHLIVIGASLKDLHHELGHTNYTFQFFAYHEASELDIQFNGSAAGKPSFYKTESDAYYKRDIFPEKRGKFLAMLDLQKKEVEYVRNSPYRSVRVWFVPNINYPVYGLNATVWDTPDTNNTGYIYVNLHKKYARMEVNLTEDASQNLQMVGYIPDKRSGYLDIWRNYEEIRIIDVTSYYKMNHSRLITGRFHWRPKIKDELKDKLHSVGTSIYNSFSDSIDFWIKTLYSESVEAVGIVWDKAKDYNENFINDIGELSVLEQDIEDLRLFMNQSYEANDFYIKTVVNFTLTVLDDLALRDHIESFPKIFTEVWQAMGDSGKALRNSIVWLIENIKKTYNNILEVVSRFFHGESLQYISTLLEKGIQKYDKFIKDLHISFIKYVENLWNKFWSMMSIYWKGVLKRLEPHMFKFMSYVESTAWELSKEVFDFIYKRTNELAESPYFNKVSSFTQDVDRLYKDIKSHDALTNIKKYSVIAWNFFKEKYFKLVPFGVELNEVITEIWDEIKKLQDIEQVQIAIQKYKEVIAKLEWVAEELQLEARLHQLYALLRNKFRNYALNALETADMYREAKTKFVFDPEVGVIDLEQKLPMSWHAFNETPKFEEIPEYKLLAQAQNIFSTTNSSIVRYIYNLRSHLDPKTWLPPYYSKALLIDSRHYMTFDKRFVGLNLRFEEMTGQQRNTQCSYLLTHDFFQRNFTLMLEPSSNTAKTDAVSKRKLSVIANDQLLEIDLENDRLTINGNSKALLPLQLGAITVHRDLDVLTIYSETEFSLNCNMEFDLCWFEVSGWYFGQTAGLLGTMNNEHFDEFMTSRNVITQDVKQFADSWSIQKCKQKESDTQTAVVQRAADVCHQFFRSGMFAACVEAVDPKAFYDICVDLASNSNPIRPDHPALKGACTTALSYIEACAAAHIPLRVPDQCVFCQLLNNSYVPEGTFIDLKGSEVPQSSDIVFIVEAKPCNANLTGSKNLMPIVAAIEEALQKSKITHNRYAVVAFGGRAPFDRPRSVIHENRVFVSDIGELKKYFDHIEMNNGTNNDILQAISTTSKLNFRPGVSKTFILLSCSDCAAQNMRFDYTSILQYMLEEGVNLHILADTEFDFEKSRKLRHFFGLDRDLVYSKRHPDGDAETRKQLHIPKNNLGICTPLALETDGTVFSARKLMLGHKYPIKRFAAIFAQRVAKSAVPNPNQTCECSGHNTGVAYMACSPSTYPAEKLDWGDYDSEFNNWEWTDEEEELEQ